jgi:hypothetical protein
VFGTLESVYFAFFLPLISYEDHQISNFFKSSLVVLTVSLFQLSYLRIQDFSQTKLKELTLRYRSLGYWIETPRQNMSSVVINSELLDYNSGVNVKSLEKKFVITYRGRYFRKVAFRSAYLLQNSLQLSWIDRAIIVILKGTV